jgi:hypothetical protein
MQASKQKTKSLQGTEGRQWRRQLAASATYANPKTIRTLKFPLTFAEPQDQHWPALQNLGNIVNSSGHGSLIGYLFALYTGGFLIFGKQAEAEAYRNGATLNDKAWREVVLSESPLTVAASTFVPSLIYQRLLVTPRAVGGKDVAFTATNIGNEWAKFFCKGKSGDKIPEAEQKLFNSIGIELTRRFEDWKAVAEDAAAAAAAVDATLRQLGYTTPDRSLSARIGSLRACEPAGSVAHNPEALQVEDCAGIELHLMVAQAMQRARENGLERDAELIKAAQISATGDPNHGGVSWVLGRGLGYFRQTSVGQIMADFDIDEKWRSSVEKVHAEAMAIPSAETTFFSDASYSPYRSKLGGLLTSWIANYAARLFDLEALLSTEIEPFELPTALLADEALLNELGIQPDDLSALLDNAIDRRDHVTACLARLTGKQRGMSRADIDAIESYNEEVTALAGSLNAIIARIDILIKGAEARKETKVKAILETYRFALPKWLKPLEKLNRLNLAPANPQQTLDQLATEFNVLHHAMHEHYTALEQWARTTGETLDVMKRQTIREAKLLGENKSGRNPEELAIRTCLQMIGGAARRCSEQTVRAVAAWMRERPVFADPIHLNQYLFNRQGRLYKSPFDKSPRQPFAIKREAVSEASTLLKQFGEFLQELRRQYLAVSAPSLATLRDLYALERAWFNVLMLGLPDVVPSDLALPASVADVFNLPTDIRLALQQSTVTSAVMRKIFNHYYVRLADISAMLFRNNWYLDAQFSRAADNALIYACKADKPQWTPPAHVFTSTKPIGSALRLLREANPDSVNGGFDSQLALSFVLGQRGKDLSDTAVRSYLRAAPHKWYYAWPTGEKIRGVQVGKDGVGKRLAELAGAAMVGPMHYMTLLDNMAADPDRVSIGDITINVRQHFTQSVERGADGKYVVTLTQTEMQVDLALPMSETRDDTVPVPFKRYVAIDLGERGLAYAVFDATSHELLERGRWGIKQMRNLVKDEAAGHRKRSPSNKFAAKFDKAEIKRRETIVGEYCHAINSLMRHYEAFPVLEYTPGGAGGNIDKIYTAVTELYLFSGTPTVDDGRAGYWAGASVWKHPTLLQYKYDKSAAKKTKQSEPLSLFPGVGASAAGTSQECSCCRRNPVSMARDWIEKLPKGASITVDEDGSVNIDGQGRIRLFKSAPEADRAAFRRKNERTPLSVPLSPMQLSGDDLLRQIRRNLRQAPSSMQTQDTQQSVYQCLFVDCGKRQHADENAAVNIGRRFQDRIPKAGLATESGG